MAEDLSRDYANADFIPDADGFVRRWELQARAWRDAMTETGHASEIVYGSHPRHKLDLFLPDGDTAPAGLVVFIHGGYWMRFDRSFWSHLAAGPVARGWAVAMPSYTLAPEARIAQITGQVATAVTAAARVVEGPIVIAGHSAGGHLAARMACTDQDDAWTGRLRRVVPISPLADLRPLMRTNLNETLRLDAAEAEAESPALRRRRADVDCIVWVGGQERPAFLWQARTLSENWACAWHVAPGRHHFDVIDDLADPHSLLVETLLA
ncbi:MAG: alpha/beta hydrolase [Pararhodobacter sp.]